MVETKENQICLKPYLLSVALLVIPSIVLTSFLGLGFYSTLFTFPILVLSTIFLVTFTKKSNKVVFEENPEASCRKLSEDHEVEDRVVLESCVSESDAAHDVGNVQEFEVESVDLPSDSESNNSGSIDWMMNPCKNVEQNPDEISDDEISVSEDDEEGLIEIAIPSSEEPKLNLQCSNLPSFLPESIFKEQDLVELLAEMNEV
ncbi:hypothetical protein COLO4_09821 [Corchorus olitorius]|uniref:Transmembrane protein n=1 Tax=Corchorus olitorius TaxID=93759 RepID=A0A1R3KAX7_9ROSI|nr:hypothetical protein COLO4_09821 [Corchorus olitorius]